MTAQSVPTDPDGEALDAQDRALLLFSLGPVQDFIAAARKAADLWAGSYLPAWLSWRAMQPVREAEGATLLFPDVRGQPLLALDEGQPPGGLNLNAATLPNRFLAAVPGEAADALADEATRAVERAFGQVVDFMLGAVGVPGGYPQELARRQADTFLECYWSILPPQADLDAYLEGASAGGAGGGRYGQRYRTVEGLHGARKALRDFGPARAPGYRCALIPRLAALVGSEGDRPGAVRTFWEGLAGRTPRGRLQAGERLSAVALAKRYFPDFFEEEVLDGHDGASVDAQFPSTSSFAAADFKADVLEECARDDALRAAVKQYEQAAQALGRGQREAPVPALREPAEAAGVASFHRISGRWLFEESFDRDRLDGQEIELPDAKREALLRARRDLLGAAHDAGIAPPSKYYALLLLDGDRMGKWLSGENAPGSRESSARYHRAVSRALNHFALHHVRRVVEEEHRGRRVYGGGDDVLAFLSFRHALPAARALRAAFSAQLGDRGAVDWDSAPPFDGGDDAPTLGHTATASAGLVFAHHLQDLGQVRKSVRATESYAKDRLDRDALAVSLMKRSGEHLTTGATWKTDDFDLVAVLERFAGRVRAGDVATGFLYDFEKLVRDLGLMPERNPMQQSGDAGRQDGRSASPSHFDDANDALRAEARRLFLRRSEPLGPVAEREKAFGDTVGCLLDGDVPEHRVAGLLDVAQFLARGGAR